MCGKNLFQIIIGLLRSDLVIVFPDVGRADAFVKDEASQCQRTIAAHGKEHRLHGRPQGLVQRHRLVLDHKEFELFLILRQLLRDHCLEKVLLAAEIPIDGFLGNA